MTLSSMDLLRIFHRSFFIQASWNYERMLALGYCACLVPFFRKIAHSQEERSRLLHRNLVFFNTHPYMANWIVGAAIKAEEERVAPDQIDRFKKRLSTVLAAIGDQLFWCDLRSICAIIGVGLTLYVGWIGAVVLLILYNVPHLTMRMRGLQQGRRHGFDLGQVIGNQRLRSILASLAILGAILAGMLVVLTMKSGVITNGVELSAFLSGIGAMPLALKWGIRIPVILATLVGMAVVLGLLIP